jgi:PleD family two-component response regulator
MCGVREADANICTITIFENYGVSSMGILVVDDSEEGRDIAEAMLLAAGYTDVSTAASAVEAYRYLAIGGPFPQEHHSVDLVLLDIMMPDIDGIEACARIRNDPRHSDVPIVMATAINDMNSLANAFVAGATDYITKPINRVELVARVRSALRLKSELDRRLARERELLEFMSIWGDNRASQWIDKATGLFIGEVAEAYLIAAADFPSGKDTSVIALAIDRFDAYRSTQGEAVAASIKARVAGAVRATATTVGVVAGAYRNGLIVLVVPELKSGPTVELGEALRAAVSKLGIANSESIAADHVTASIVVVSGRPDRWTDRFNLLTRAIAAIPRVTAAGGNRVVLEQS